MNTREALNYCDKCGSKVDRKRFQTFDGRNFWRWGTTERPEMTTTTCLADPARGYHIVNGQKNAGAGRTRP